MNCFLFCSLMLLWFSSELVCSQESCTGVMQIFGHWFVFGLLIKKRDVPKRTVKEVVMDQEDKKGSINKLECLDFRRVRGGQVFKYQRKERRNSKVINHLFSVFVVNRTTIKNNTSEMKFRSEKLETTRSKIRKKMNSLFLKISIAPSQDL